jgi:hypothetical protein
MAIGDVLSEAGSNIRHWCERETTEREGWLKLADLLDALRVYRDLSPPGGEKDANKVEPSEPWQED